MSFELRRLILGEEGRFALPIDKARCMRIVKARECILAILSIEEKMDLVLGNYTEMEVDLLEQAAQYLSRGETSSEDMLRSKNLVVNRRFLNLLSSCRSYMDHVPHLLNELESSAENSIQGLHELFKGLASQQYDASLAYRTMEALRNHVQHRGFPINVSYTGRWHDTNNGGRLMISLVTSLSLENLQEDRKFKTTVLNELLILGKDPDARRFCAEYVGCIGRIHETVLAKIDGISSIWRSELLKAIEDFCAASATDSALGLAIVSTKKDDGIPPIYVSRRAIDYSDFLRKKRCSFNRFEDRFLSSEQLNFID